MGQFFENCSVFFSRGIKSTIYWSALFSTLLSLSACFTLPQSPLYRGPPERPAELEEYYSKGKSYLSFKIETVREKRRFTQKKITIETEYGQVLVDLFQRKKESDELVLVFPVLGGKNMIEKYFAEYFCRNGFDSAIVNRNNDFKDPALFDRLEQVFRENAIRDRIALDFFEKELRKSKFATFGISRGAINVGITAGIDPRLKHNVLALGGTDLVQLFRDSDQPRIRKYREKIMQLKNISADEFFDILTKSIRTDPKFLSQYIDARNTLMILALFDQTVPFKYGLRMRKQIGKPRTIFLLAGHYSALLYTQFVRIIRPNGDLSSFPLDYVETRALEFYEKSFGRERLSFKKVALRVVAIPMNVVGAVVSIFF